MRLFIAEKPSVGRAIAEILGNPQPQKGEKGVTHILAGDAIVSWCFGHLLEMAQPEEYGEQYKQWDFATLPMIPSEWKLIPKNDAKAQVSVLKKLLKECTEIVHAGDPDREGQLLVDELLEHLGNSKPVKRIWLAALDEASIKKALSSLKDNKDYANLKKSAECRQRGDWLVGMNFSRAYTLAARKSGFDSVVSIGRVQTPTLALVVNRDITIDNFKPKDFFGVIAKVNGNGAIFSARWKPSTEVPVDESGRLLDKSVAESVVKKVSGQSGVVKAFDSKEKKQAPPLPFCLSTLQVAANKKLGLSAQEVLDLAQELYEEKITTYPRTDCSYLPESQFGDALKILSGLAQQGFGNLAQKADVALKSAVWNDAKITAHHAIIPTGTVGNLSGNKAALFDLIARAYIAQFYPHYTFQETTIQLEIASEAFVARGNIPLNQGWKTVFHTDDEDSSDEEQEEKQSLPTLKTGQSVQCQNASVESKKTTPLQRFTEGSLIQAMTNIHQFVTDPEQKKRLKETAGVGTEATRAGIIETLKKRGFIIEQKKQLVSSDTGRKLIQCLADNIKSPGLTALFEQLLDGVAEGRITGDQFLSKQIEYVRKYVDLAKSTELKIGETHSCPTCKTGQLRRIKGEKDFFWCCNRYKEGCKTSFPDKKGAPDLKAKPKAKQSK